MRFVFFIFKKRNKEKDFSKDVQGNIDVREKIKGAKNNAKELLLSCNNIAFRF